MIKALRRLFGRGGLPKVPCAAPFGDSLLLVVSRWRSIDAGRLRASGSFGRYKVAVRDLGDGHGQQPRGRPLDALLDELVPRLCTSERSELFDFVLAHTLPDLDQRGSVSLATDLRLLRDRLREPLPEYGNQLTSGRVLVVDTIAELDPRSFWVGGWCVDTDGSLGEVELISPEGQRAPLLEGAYRFPRADVEESLASVGVRTNEQHGFSKYLELPARSPLSEGWLAERRSRAGGGFELALPAVTRDRVVARDRIMGELSADQPGIDALRRNHARPALERLQQQLVESVEVEREVQHGTPPADPEVSIVVPLYERIDLIEYQLAHFWQDPDFHAVELIYVLDSPASREPLARLAGALHELYGIPFKVMDLNRNAGYSTANNLAAARARGRLLLLLNSDVLPVRERWLSKLRAFHEATPQIGALGPKLLYEDDSIQHAGMYFQRDPETRFWENQHYFKGFSRPLAAANVSRPVPAVTGACLMVERALYEEVGGLSPMYVQGGYEDSDLCLKLIEAGRRNWYLADVELYHLEAQSFPIHLRASNRYNAWRQTDLWDERIEQTMAAQAATADARVVAIG